MDTARDEYDIALDALARRIEEWYKRHDYKVFEYRDRLIAGGTIVITPDSVPMSFTECTLMGVTFQVHPSMIGKTKTLFVHCQFRDCKGLSDL